MSDCNIHQILPRLLTNQHYLIPYIIDQAALFCQQTGGVRDALEARREHHHGRRPDCGQGGDNIRMISG